MSKDLIGALILIGVFVFMMALRLKAPAILQTLSNSRQLSTVVLLGGIAYLYHKGYHMTALIGGLFAVYLLKTFWVTWPRSDESRLYTDIAKDRARFDAGTSVDLQFANKTLTHNLPVLLVKPYFPDLMVYTPSAQTLEEMNG